MPPAQGALWTLNAHVAGASALRVRLADGRVFAARLVARDPRRDLPAHAVEGFVRKWLPQQPALV